MRRERTVDDDVRVFQKVLGRYPAPLFIETGGMNIASGSLWERYSRFLFCRASTRHISHMELVLMEMILNNARGKEKMLLTIERPTTTNSREPNMTRIILLRSNTAYALEPHTAVSFQGRVGKMKK